jgi:hypothetical protein
MIDKREWVIDYNTGTAQPPIFLDDVGCTFRGVQLAPVVTGVGYVQASLSSRAAIEAGDGAWVTWPAGSISSVAQDTIDPSVTAIRVYRTSSALRLNVRAV